MEARNLNPDPLQPSGVKLCRKRKTAAKSKNEEQSVKMKKQKLEINFRWSDEPFTRGVELPQTRTETNTTELTPGDYFIKFFSEEAIEHILYHSNLYGLQKTGETINLTRKTILQYLSIQLMMGVVKMPAYTDYWARRIRYKQIADIMPLKHYKFVRRNLHFCDNSVTSEDSYYKIREFLDIIRKNCVAQKNEKHQSIDEMMVPYKAGHRRQYNLKPKKWGFKLFVRTGVSGIIYDFLLHHGPNTFDKIEFSKFESNFSMTSKVIIALSKTIPDTPLTSLCFNDLFSTAPLMVHLRKEYGILALGTITENCLPGVNFPCDKQLKDKGRGSYAEKTDNNNGIVVVKLFENKSVVFASTFVGVDPIQKKKIWSKEENSKIDADCPQVAVKYNQHMEGVDLADRLIALYRTDYMTHKWYMALFSQLLDISVNNAWLTYRQDVGKDKAIPLKTFRWEVAQSLLRKNEGGPKSSGEPASSSSDRSTPQTHSFRHEDEHLPIFGEKGRCRNCKTGSTSIYCNTCNARLCVVPARNCFMQYHLM